MVLRTQKVEKKTRVLCAAQHGSNCSLGNISIIIKNNYVAVLCALQIHHKITLHCPLPMIDGDTSAESSSKADESARDDKIDVNN